MYSAKIFIIWFIFQINYVLTFYQKNSIKSSYQNDFWRSCDTEDWSNDAENTALHHRNKLHFTIYSHRKHLFWNVIIFHNF